MLCGIDPSLPPTSFHLGKHFMGSLRLVTRLLEYLPCDLPVKMHLGQALVFWDRSHG